MQIPCYLSLKCLLSEEPIQPKKPVFERQHRPLRTITKAPLQPVFSNRSRQIGALSEISNTKRFQQTLKNLPSPQRAVQPKILRLSDNAEMGSLSEITNLDGIWDDKIVEVLFDDEENQVEPSWIKQRNRSESKFLFLKIIIV